MKNYYKSATVFAPQVFELFEASYGVSPWTINTIILDLAQENRLFISAFADGKLVGFLSAIKVLPELEISNIAVLPSYQNQGIAGQLIGQLKACGSVIFLEVRESNQKAKQLYLKAGFYQTGLRKKYYQEPEENAILMEWRKNVYPSD
ncbi:MULTISPECIES: ribosomal protein S18-alanine N-acetyltransferase [unclassified Enterococcus]|uniref:ribosomal protein S18-alanine N-acetyltransferase n=1 Tax=unclassified Enterococcus TaxID=2608891 RepID=UPI0015519A9C|nr:MULTISPECIES: ribosomal protein S18-alanine N-acetyltransferase [unclassified Enterococcus]MBS7577802.1 ribosomal protein S18-alanine N-acetyltransferase [Enterococcus sp. MMGLQ5-2]MBS7585062.1 ribosomal protein S18-alanine N-acetyltransferase [Enterococcus sp. MMGLQ5-1]NPD12918.1 ribosomal protein S18-alanine N-acetyltransferase [Enterococcus sp. MMGLQ5-1]NPD37632.1 ribosomal protein S18-alanine N-acetyltransferase [Enterococcus sp. MMGLQ5-2]